MEKERSGHSRLGKGLASLLPPTPSPVPPPPIEENVSSESTNRDRHLGISMCSLDEIVPNEFQPRKQFDDSTIDELSQSIKVNGLIQPLIVRKALKGYQLIAGERRWRAAKKAGLQQVPIVIRRTTDKEALELALIENIQREDLNCFDTALAYYQLIHDFDLKQEELGARVGKDRASVSNHLRLLKLPQFIQNALKEKQLTFGHGRALAGLEETDLAEKLANAVIEKKWSVRELESQIQKIKNLQEGRQNKSTNGDVLDPLALRMRNLGRDMSKKLGTKVRLRGQEERGKIIIEYFNREELDRVIDHLLS